MKGNQQFGMMWSLIIIMYTQKGQLRGHWKAQLQSDIDKVKYFQPERGTLGHSQTKSLGEFNSVDRGVNVNFM